MGAVAPTARSLTGRPRVEFLDGGNRRLLEDLIIDLGVFVPELHRWEYENRRSLPSHSVYLSDDDTTVVQVPAGLTYDGASIPVLAQLVAGEKDLYELAAALHDFLYRYQAPRKASDDAFWNVARTGKGVGPVRGWLTWAGLRIGGWWAYLQNGRRKAARERSLREARVP